MSILNGGSFVGSALGAALTAKLGVSSTDFSNLFLLVLLCNFSTLLPAPFLGLLPASLDQDSITATSGGDSAGSSSHVGAGSGHSKQAVQLPVIDATHSSNGSASSRGAGVRGEGQDVGNPQDVPLQSGRQE